MCYYHIRPHLININKWDVESTGVRYGQSVGRRRRERPRLYRVWKLTISVLEIPCHIFVRDLWFYFIFCWIFLYFYFGKIYFLFFFLYFLRCILLCCVFIANNNIFYWYKKWYFNDPFIDGGHHNLLYATAYFLLCT